VRGRDVPSKQSDYIILTDKDAVHVWQELEDGLWYCHVVRDDAIVTDDLGPFKSKTLALKAAIEEYLESDK
jgi:hypothetical protein